MIGCLIADKSSSNSIIQWTRKVEKWSDIVRKLNIDMLMPVNYVTPQQIKQISNEEPRLMAKIDKLESLPKIFRDICSWSNMLYSRAWNLNVIFADQSSQVGSYFCQRKICTSCIVPEDATGNYNGP